MPIVLSEAWLSRLVADCALPQEDATHVATIGSGPIIEADYDDPLCGIGVSPCTMTDSIEVLVLGRGIGISVGAGRLFVERTARSPTAPAPRGGRGRALDVA